jgi:peptidyl-prolyl cis-trans isomerase A (cyclophilin A)
MSRHLLLAAGWVALCAPASPRTPAALPPQRLPHVIIETSLGAIALEIDSVRAPLSAANFLRYVDAGVYDGGRIHRTVRADNQPNDSVRIEVIQGGGNTARAADRRPPIALERTNVTGLSHRDGTISMARSGPDTAVWDFFICIGDQPSLDFGGKRNADGQGFAAFGRVVSGMDIVRRIQSSPATRQSLTPPVQITRMRRM